MTLIRTQPAESQTLPFDPILPLENGDALTRPEFERRYDAMPDLKKAELIEGIVYMGSPVSTKLHGTPHAQITTWLGLYSASTSGLLVSADSSVRLDMENMPQPDAFLLLPFTPGGQTQFSKEGYVEGAPELVAEIASSTASIDLHAKFNAYRRNGVREYLVWRTRNQAIDWFILREDRYERLSVSPDGLYRSEAFPGLWLDAAALIRGDLWRVLETLRQGLAAPEHAAFVARLAQKAQQEG